MCVHPSSSYKDEEEVPLWMAWYKSDEYYGSYSPAALEKKRLTRIIEDHNKDCKKNLQKGHFLGACKDDRMKMNVLHVRYDVQ